MAILGAHGNENFRDWYTGTSTYYVTILEAMKTLLPEAEISYNDCRDIIAVRSKATGMYLKVNDDETVTANGMKNDQSCHFIKEDWGGEIVLKSVKNGKYITLDGGYKASCDSLFTWFVMPILKPYVTSRGVTYKSWNDRSVLVDENGVFTAMYRSRTEEDQLFTEEIIVDGIATAARLASACDCAIVCVGNNPMIVARECYDRDSLELPYFQAETVKAPLNPIPTQ